MQNNSRNRLVSMQLWHSLDEERRAYEMRDLTKLQRLWKSAQSTYNES